MTTQPTKTLATKTNSGSNANAPVQAETVKAKKAAAPQKKAEKKSPYAKLTPSKPVSAFKHSVHSAFPPQLPGNASDLTSSIQQTFAKLFPAAPNLDKIFSEKTREFSKNQQQVFGIGSEGLSKIAQTTEQATAQLNDAINASRDNIEAVIECGNIAQGLTKSIGNKLTELANEITAQNINAAQQFLSCRTASDILNVQNEYIRSNVDNAFNNSLKIAELLAQFTKVAEPLNERIANATEQFAKKRK